MQKDASAAPKGVHLIPPRYAVQSGANVNRWDIPDWLEEEVKERDKACVYCGIQMIEQMAPTGPRKAVPMWEHIINDASIITRENIARCCAACNSSKGTKKLAEWLQSSYCKEARHQRGHGRGSGQRGFAG
jgi:hypothetical protein